MAGLNNLAEIGKQGMLLSQFGIQVTGKNISNVNTRGYSRQRLDVNPVLPEILAGFTLGSWRPSTKMVSSISRGAPRI